MGELIALWIVCRNVGAIARSRGVRARPHQVRAVVLWVAFEVGAGLLARTLGLGVGGIYLAALAGAVASLHFSFAAVRSAGRPAAPPLPATADD